MSQQLTCSICDETEADPSLLSDCDSCGSFYHLNPRSDREGKDCGNVWAGYGDEPALQFWCQNCIDEAAEEAATLGPQLTPIPIPSDGAPAMPGGAILPGMDPDDPMAAFLGYAPRQDGPEDEQQSEGPPPAPRRDRPRRRFRRIDA